MPQIRSRGCAPGCGIALITAGVIFLCINFGIIPWRIARWWPILIIALGFALLVRHYWLLLRERGPVSRMPASSPGAPGPVDRHRSWKPPALPVVVCGVGVYELLKNLGYLTLGVSIAVILIVCGLALVLGGGASIFRSRGSGSPSSGAGHLDA
jgi:hypothetical protein